MLYILEALGGYVRYVTNMIHYWKIEGAVVNLKVGISISKSKVYGVR